MWGNPKLSPVFRENRMSQELTSSTVLTTQEQMRDALKASFCITVPDGTEIVEVCITTSHLGNLGWYDTKNPDGSTVRHLI
ncbi:hypothetical protein GCM10022631_26500 [Deinococcus rubellus]